MKKRYLADLILFIASMIWGLGYFFQKAASETTAPLTFNCLRYLIAALVLGCLARFRYPRGEGLKYAVLTGVVMSCAGNAQQIGMQTASIGNSSFITAIYIVLVPFLSALLLHRKIRLRHYLAALLSLIGLFFITTAGKGLERISVGDMIVFIGSIFWAMQILCVDKAVTLCDPVSFTAAQFLTAAVLQCLKEREIDATDISVKVCNGAVECKNALTLMKLGRLPESFMEGMICEGGCVSGPARQKALNELKKDRDAMIARADARGVHENLKLMNAEQVPMHRD